MAAPKAAPLPAGLSRGAILAAVLTAAACAENSAYSPVAVYGAPPAPDGPTLSDAGSDASEVISPPVVPPPVALYGAAPPQPVAAPDAGAPAPVDAGAKPVKDAGAPKKRPDPGGGTMAPMYGVPPGD